MNLFGLMLDSQIQSITQDGLDQMQDKFQLQKNSEEAEKHFLQLVDESVEALFPVIIDKFHRVAMLMKK